ncbi:MAG: 23S rRNA (guanosine(2251)-2'-O)-methyltransferase RlmB [Anaerolineaceae bacterium]
MKEWITGRNPSYEILRAKRRQVFRLVLARGIKPEGQLSEVLRLAKSYGIPIEEAPRDRLDAFSTHHQGVALETSAYPYAAFEDLLRHAQAQPESPFFLLLDLIQDPQNLGSLLRTAEAMGVHGVVIPSSQAAQITPTVVHASSGATEHLLIAQNNLAQAIERIKQLDVWVYGLDEAPRSKPPAQLRLEGGIALVVGNEGSGLRELVRKSCDELLRLPMVGKVESLNAAAAGSIALYLVRQARGNLVQ